MTIALGRKRREHGRLYRSLMDAQQWRCGLCAGHLFARADFPRGRGVRSPLYPTIDHVVPKALGGRTKGNIMLAHCRCNRRKADRAPTGCELIMLAAVNARLGEGA